MAKVTTEQVRLMREVRNDPEAYALLKEKARWEHMTLFATLAEWGDPREWLKKLT